MLVKRIVCQVPEDGPVSFSEARSRWSRLSGVSGFEGQVGGWDLRSTHTAFVLALWRDRASYDAFIYDLHDDLVSPERSYGAIDVSPYESLFDLPARYPTIAPALDSGQMLRVANCKVRAGRREHFLEVQRGVWRPGMAKADGMLGGSFDLSAEDERRFLVTTFWRDEAAHEDYVRDDLPSLRRATDVDDDVEELTGHLVSLEPSWRVLPA